jgi:hypothetical protein
MTSAKNFMTMDVNAIQGCLEKRLSPRKEVHIYTPDALTSCSMDWS